MSLLTESDTSSSSRQPSAASRRRWWLLLGAATVGLVLLALLRSGEGNEFTASGAPVPLPPEHSLVRASLRDFEGMLVGLRGKPVVVNIWASWCGPCRVEAPLLQRAAVRYRGDVVFIGVDSSDDMDAGRGFLDRFRITYPNVFDESGSIRAALGLQGFPTTYIFNRQGRLEAKVFGGIAEQTLAARIVDARR